MCVPRTTNKSCEDWLTTERPNGTRYAARGGYQLNRWKLQPFIPTTTTTFSRTMIILSLSLSGYSLVHLIHTTLSYISHTRFQNIIIMIITGEIMSPTFSKGIFTIICPLSSDVYEPFLLVHSGRPKDPVFANSLVGPCLSACFSTYEIYLKTTMPLVLDKKNSNKDICICYLYRIMLLYVCTEKFSLQSYFHQPSSLR